MSEYISTRDENGQANGSNFTLETYSLNKSPKNSRKYNLNYNKDEQALGHYLLREALPDLIIKIIGTDHEQTPNSLRASIQNALKVVICTLMQQTNIWILNGTRAMIDLEEYDKKLDENDEINPNIVICEPFGKSQLLIYHPETYRYIDQILFQIQQQQTSSFIPLITLLVQGNNSSVDNIVENTTKYIPTIILKGTGLIANQLAALYEPIRRGFKKIHGRTSNPQILTEADLHRLANIKNNDPPLIFVCQPGKDELDENILEAIGATIRITDSSRARVMEFNFAVQWNKIDYAQRHILNYTTVINWTNAELDTCLEMAICLNAVSFVELLFEYGASLQRLALVGNTDIFKLKSEERRGSQMIELVIESIPVLTELDSDKRVKAYLRLLFAWTVENEYFELVTSICTRSEDSIIALLLVSQWCQYKEQNDYTTSINYRNHRRQFETYAANILDLYYADNEEKTTELLDEKSVLYKGQQPLALMEDLCSKTLVSTKCMQAHMSSLWYGNQFHIEKNFTWEILICLVCICPLLLLIPMIRNRVFQWDKIQKIERPNTFWNRIKYKFEPFRRFYQGNAVIRFHYNMGSYIVFLLLFSYTILFDYFPLNIYNERRSNIYRLPISLTELILHVFLASIALEEYRQVIEHVKSVATKSAYWEKLSNKKNRHRTTIWSFYKNDPWNRLDFVAFALWIIAFITRFIVRDNAFEASKICMSLDLCLWFMRCLHVFLASERLGPKLLMIFHTMKDLISFLFFILIFLFAYTITTYSLISTSSTVIWSNSTYFTTVQTAGNTTTIEFLRNIIEWGTWRIFGSTSLSTSDSMDIRYSAKNDAYGFVTLLLTITFLIIAYVLLLNNLIAIFNFTIQRVHGESHRAWCYHFYVVLKEYEEKDSFVPPFNLIFLPLCHFIRKHFANHIQNESVVERNNREKEQLQRHQQRIAEKYWKEKHKNANGSSTQRPYVCRQCKCRGTEADYTEWTFL